MLLQQAPNSSTGVQSPSTGSMILPMTTGGGLDTSSSPAVSSSPRTGQWIFRGGYGY